MPVRFLAYLRVSSSRIKEQRELLWTPANRQQSDKEGKEDLSDQPTNKPTTHPSTATSSRTTQRNMHLSSVPLCGLLLILNLQLFSAYPINTGLTDTDMDILKVILNRLEESVLEQTEVDQGVPAERDSLDSLKTDGATDRQQSQTGLDDVMIREFLSAKNLKSVRSDSSRRSSSCFDKPMDRIGSMSTLGCNVAGKYNPKVLTSKY